MAVSSGAPPRLVDSGNSVALWLIEENNQPGPSKVNRVVSLPNDLGRAARSRPKAQSQASSMISNPSPILNSGSSTAQPQNGSDQQPGPSSLRGQIFVQTTAAPQPVPNNNHIQDLTTIQHPTKSCLEMKYRIPSRRSNPPGNSNTAQKNKRSINPSENQQQETVEILEPSAQSPASSEPPIVVLNEPLVKRSRRPISRPSNSNGFLKEKPVWTLFEDEKAKIVECPTCRRQFAKFKHLVAHFYFHGLLKQDQCDICGWVFFDPVRKENDKIYHSKGKPYYCNFCGVYFDLKFKLDMHKGYCTKDPNNPLKCTRCNEIFGGQKDLENHIKDVHCKSSTPIPCIMCNINASDISSLNHHFMKRHKLNGYKKLNVWCDKCGKGFGSKSDLKRHHSNIHAYDDPKESKVFVCLCGQSFPDEDMIDEHPCRITVDFEEQEDSDCNDVSFGTDNIDKVLKDAFSGQYVCPVIKLPDVPALRRKLETITGDCRDLNTMFYYQICAARMIHSELRKKHQIMKRDDLRNAIDFTSRLVKRINFMEKKITSVLQEIKIITDKLSRSDKRFTPFLTKKRTVEFVFAKRQKEKIRIVGEIEIAKAHYQSAQQPSNSDSPEVFYVMNLDLAIYVEKALEKARPKNWTLIKMEDHQRFKTETEYVTIE